MVACIIVPKLKDDAKVIIFLTGGLATIVMEGFA